jgi:hypothetical protein
MLGLLLLACEQKKSTPAPTPAPAQQAPAQQAAPPAAPPAEGAQLDKVTLQRTAIEMERRCREGGGFERGTECLVAATAYEFGNEGVEKDRQHAQRIYDAACRVHANAPGHDVAWFCDASQRLKNEFAAEAAADAGH